MGKKAMKKATDDVEEETAEMKEEPETKPSSKGKAKAKAAVEVEEKVSTTEKSKEDIPAAEGAEKDIFEEKSEVAKQFETAEPKEEITEERTYIVPLSHALMVGPKYRAKRAINEIKKFFLRHMKAQELVILPEVNEHVWARGAGHPPRKIKIRATKSIEGTVTLYLAE
jgi:large subunit ribosomal protein L31e